MYIGCKINEGRIFNQIYESINFICNKLTSTIYIIRATTMKLIIFAQQSKIPQQNDFFKTYVPTYNVFEFRMWFVTSNSYFCLNAFHVAYTEPLSNYYCCFICIYIIK